MKVIVFTDDMKLSLAERLVAAGLPIACLPELLGMSSEKLYYRLKGLKQREKQKEEKLKKKSIRRLETAARLLEEGLPLDVVATLTEVSGLQILSWLSETEE